MNPVAASTASGIVERVPVTGVAGASRRHARTLLFASTLFTSATLIFIVEPMVAKLLLPRLGGTPAVWNTCMVFYQTVLLAGYGYAHLLSRRCSLSTQMALHAVLLVAAATQPISIPADWAPPVDHSPIAALLLELTQAAGLPLLALFATAPLLQNWFAQGDDDAARDPYFLYAASNVGSILALLAYPLVIEPTSTLSAQRTVWAAGYCLFVALTLTCGWVVRRRRTSNSSPETAPVGPQTQPLADPTTWRRRQFQRARWTVLAFVPSSLMLGATTYITTDVASAPLLWTIPLALYLLSFVIAFSNYRPLPAVFAWRITASAIVVLATILSVGLTLPGVSSVLLHLVALFCLAVALHTLLAQERPDATRLTEFYLWIAVGGVCGGLFNTLLAPFLFTGVAEYPIAILAAAWLLQPPVRAEWRWQNLLPPATAGVSVLVLIYFFSHDQATPATMTATGLVLVFSYLTGVRGRFGLGLCVLCVFCAGWLGTRPPGDLLYASRTFFGVLRVWNAPDQHQHRLTHGTTLHGAQSTVSSEVNEPLSYYGRVAPVGQIFQARSHQLEQAGIGVVGLGAGSLAAYARPGQRWTFFEVDPEVERIARDPAYFSYLQRCGSACQVELGDARRSLSRAGAPDFDLLILDAFSSDAIPVHLITREALIVYLQHLRDGGLLVFHISNRHLALRPLVGALVAEQHLAARAQFFRVGVADAGLAPSEWVVAGRHEADLGAVATDPRWQKLTGAGQRVWTDDFSDILSVLKL
jgi:hypothetical protein